MDTVTNNKHIASQLFREANKFIPGGVNSPVRSFKSVGGYPVFVAHANGSKIYGECDTEFIDYCLSWGAMILGHAHPEVTSVLQEAVKRGTSFGTATKLEIELARLIVEAVSSIEQARLTNSGTEAVMGALRLARAYTKRNKIIKFEGAYHGHADYLLAKAGSGIATLGVPDSSGVPEDFTKHTITLPYNDIDTVKQAIRKYSDDIAAIIVEPVAANSGVILPNSGFLEGLRAITDKYGIVLVFDEVITGFRLSFGGAQELFNIKPDITCLGKIIGGGLPVGAFGGKKEIMKLLAPEGDVYQAGTLSGNPIAVAAGKATLELLKKTRPYMALDKRTQNLCEGIKNRAQEKGIDVKVNSAGSIFSVFFTKSDVKNYKTAKSQNVNLFNKFFHGLLKEGIYFSPSGFEANFMSITHTDKNVDKTLEAVAKTFKML